jgi:hypothetical protein
MQRQNNDVSEQYQWEIIVTVYQLADPVPPRTLRISERNKNIRRKGNHSELRVEEYWSKFCAE